jgi:UDP-2-acetamido-3-amino-2,3-dideoxy-glucuronate N-acetyltransferase
LSSQTVRIAIVGAGRWGRNLVRVFASTARCTVHAVCDVNAASLSAPELDRIPVRHVDLPSLLRDHAIDAVAIATPSPGHAHQAVAILEAGKHVFVEKPMALSLSDAERMRSAALFANRRLMVGHLMRYHAGIAELRRLVKAGAIGELRRAVTVRSGPGASSPEGPWWALAPHDLSLLGHFFDSEILDVSAVRRSTTEGTQVTARVRLASGTGEIVVGSGQMRKMRRLLLVGTRGSAVLDDAGPEPLAFLLGATPTDIHPLRDLVLAAMPEWRSVFPAEQLTVANEEPLRREASHFIDAVLDGSPIATDADEGCRVVAALEAGAASMNASGRRTPLATPRIPHALSGTA